MNRAEIVQSLTLISNEAQFFAILWHAVATVGFVALALGWRPQVRYAAAALALPALSVSMLAFGFGNPFNGAMFLLLATMLVVRAARGAAVPVRQGPRWARRLGTALIAFGWLYPHFVRVDGPFEYLYTSPLGLIPCPTLAMITGIALAAGGFGLRSWTLWVAAFGIFYGFFGAVVLGVYLDVVLVAGSLALLLIVWIADRTGEVGIQVGRRWT